MSDEAKALRELLDLIKDDGHALCFQTFAQYRQVLIGEVRRKLRDIEGAPDAEPKLHWYLFTFAWGNRQATRAYGFSTPEIGGGRMREAKKLCGCPPTAVILSISQLGYMSQAEMEGEDHEFG